MAKKINAEYKFIIPYMPPLMRSYAKYFSLDDLGYGIQVEWIWDIMNSDGKYVLAASYWSEGEMTCVELEKIEDSNESYQTLATSMLKDFSANFGAYYKVKLIYTDGRIADFIPKAEKIVLEKVTFSFKDA